MSPVRRFTWILTNKRKASMKKLVRDKVLPSSTTSMTKNERFMTATPDRDAAVEPVTRLAKAERKGGGVGVERGGKSLHRD
jgi:hypothetical protein